VKHLLKHKLGRCARQFADRMNRKAAHYSGKQQKFGLAVFCLLFSTISISVLFQTFSAKSSAAKIFALPAHAPAHIGKNPEPPAPFISKKDYERIEKFKHSLDSNTLRTRTGLSDSIRLFEQLYTSQLKR
jgi:hypothetical protein